MNDLSASFTFRLSQEDKAALGALADRLGCDRGAALRRFIRQSVPSLGREGHFVTPTRQFHITLKEKGRPHDR
jgi:predicted transcriptional regulator